MDDDFGLGSLYCLEDRMFVGDVHFGQINPREGMLGKSLAEGLSKLSLMACNQNTQAVILSDKGKRPKKTLSQP